MEQSFGPGTLLKMSLNKAIFLISYQALFIILGYGYDRTMTNGFMLLYWAQFVWGLFVDCSSDVANRYMTANNIDKMSHLALDYHKTVELSCTLGLLLVFLVTMLCNEKIMEIAKSLLHMNPSCC